MKKAMLTALILSLFVSTILCSFKKEAYIEKLEKKQNYTLVESFENTYMLKNPEGNTEYLLFTGDFHQETGYNGITNTAVFLNDELEIIDLEIVHSEDTKSYIRKLKSHRFLNQFLGKPDYSSIKPVTGATISSKAIINSIRISIHKARKELKRTDKINP